MIALLRFCLALCLGFLSLPSSGQELPRAGFMGVRTGFVPDSLAQAYGLSSSHGAEILGVLPGGTADGFGLRQGDVVLAVNGEAVRTPANLTALVSAHQEGETISITRVRNGVREQLEGVLQGVPRETAEHADVVYGSVPFRDGALRSILHIPHQESGPHPVVFILQGLGCVSIEQGLTPRSPMRQLIDGLVERGYAVYRVEKPGVGDSRGTVSCSAMGFDDEIAAFEAAYFSLATAPSVDPNRVVLFGHSLGGVVAPLLAQTQSPAGIITYGTVAKPWFEYLIDYYREQLPLRGTDYASSEAATRDHIPLLYEYLILHKTPEELRQSPELRALLDQGALGYDGGEQILGRHYTFFQELQNRDLTMAWSQAGVPTLALHGEFDLEAISAEGAQRIAAIVEAAQAGYGTYRLIPQTEHGFVRVPSLAAYVTMRNTQQFTPAYRAMHFNTELVEVIDEWLHAHL